MSRQQMLVQLKEFHSSRRSAMDLAVVSLALSLVGGATLLSTVAHAGTLNHGDFTGTTVMFSNVTETSDDPVPLYGTPITEGNTLRFFPANPPSPLPNPSLGFAATAPASDITDGFLSFGLMASPGHSITTVEISEGGDYALVALVGSSAQVTANLIIQEIAITHVDGLPIAPIVATDLQSVTFNFPSGASAGLWNLSSLFDINQILIDAGIAFDLGATKLTVSLDNILLAIADPSAAATIRKKDFAIDVGTGNVPVPEPATCVLGMLGLTMVLVSRRRKI